MASLDSITIHQQVISALRSYSGLHGSATSVDVLKVDSSTNEAWIRVPKEDVEVLRAAVSCWTGRSGTTMRIEGEGTWLGALGGMSRKDKQKMWSLD